MASTSRAVEIEWREVDELSRGNGHGVEIFCTGDDGGALVAFIVGFEWLRGAPRAEVQVLRGTAKAWARVGGSTPALHDELVAIVHEVLAGAPLTLRRGRFGVGANG